MFFVLTQHRQFVFIYVVIQQCLQCFVAVGWAAGRASGL